MVAAWSKFTRYNSVVCFADDVAEALYLSKRINNYSGDVTLLKTRPGQYEFILEDGFEGTVCIRKTGLVEIFRGVGRERIFDQCPLPILSVQRAERLKEDLVHETFLLLKGDPIEENRANWCFLMHRTYFGEWEAYDGGFFRWAKKNLWPI